MEGWVETDDLRLAHVYKGIAPAHCCCDQLLRPLPDGRWIMIFMTGGNHEPEPANYVARCYSADRGRTWTQPERIFPPPGRAACLTEAYTHNGDIRLFAQSHLGRFDDWRVHLLTSRDGGDSWESEDLAPAPRRNFIRNRTILADGTWIFPLQTYDLQDVPDPRVSTFDDGSAARAHVGALITTDEGRTWTVSPVVGPIYSWAEPNIVELGDGTLAMLVRHDRTGVLYRTNSTDGGHSWSPPAPTDIPNPGSKFRLHKLRDGRILLIHNPSPTPNVRWPLGLWVSADDLATWSTRRVLVDFPGRLSYPDGFVDEDEGWVHFVFDYNRHDVIYVGARIPE